MLLFTGIFYFISNYKTLKAGFMGEQAILVLVLIMSSRIGFVTPGRKIIVDSWPRWSLVVYAVLWVILARSTITVPP